MNTFLTFGSLPSGLADKIGVRIMDKDFVVHPRMTGFVESPVEPGRYILSTTINDDWLPVVLHIDVEDLPYTGVETIPALKPSGIYPLRIQVRDQEGNPVLGARVFLTETPYQEFTEASGNVLFNVDANTYFVGIASHPLYETPELVEVNLTEDRTITITVVRRPLGESTEPGTRPVAVWLRQFGIYPRSGAEVGARLLSPFPLSLPDSFGYDSTQREKSDASGLILFTLLTGYQYQLFFPDGASKKVFVEEGTTTVNAHELPESAP